MADALFLKTIVHFDGWNMGYRRGLESRSDKRLAHREEGKNNRARRYKREPNEKTNQEKHDPQIDRGNSNVV